MSVTVRSFFLLWLLVQPSTNHAFHVPKSRLTTVIVTNELQGGRDLLLHCKSADDDLGVQHLHPQGTFSWSFKLNFFGTTLFHCSFQWDSVLHRFDIYKANRDAARCSLCSWVVREDGPCLIFAGEKDQCSHWNSLEKRPNFLS
ncbi:hypothetical protein PHAVU_011G169266 [Phaseolus vulgaris]|uniref:S-protein homolog n=1 Tax=Phaseolus vulgaris TaxID=3885 RepID=V7D2M7_PHAVU|nr:hypothetical protein PHAVU_L001600g [Phaseolus vulgaris]ESW35963.1 hypothetical protein PHAVU_L001600g [Phaseolus vulgaris]